MAVQQLSVFAPNKNGALGDVLSTVADAGVDIRAMSIADTQNYGIVRMIVSDPKAAEAALKGRDFLVSVNPVTVVSVSDRPGALTDVLRVLSDNGLTVEYLYAFGSGSSANVVMRLSDNALASRLIGTMPFADLVDSIN